MRRFVRSEGYARARLFTGALFILFGACLIYRMLGAAGFAPAAIPGVVLGAAMIALGALRFRDYRAARK